MNLIKLFENISLISMMILFHHYESKVIDFDHEEQQPSSSSSSATSSISNGVDWDEQQEQSEMMDDYTITNDTRRGRTFLSDLGFLRPTIFNIVRFPNEECLDAGNQSGTCYTPLECKKLGGNPSSKCAKGLGTCCIMSRTCHNSTFSKVVYFRNPSFPLTDSEQNFCDLNVNIIDADICQLRIDFLEFQIDPPVRGSCAGDRFTVTASGMTPNSVPVLCGNNRNQHIYITLPANQEKRSVSIVFETNAVGDYRFHLKVTQIDCRVRQAPVQNGLTISSIQQQLSSSSSSFRQSRMIYQKIPNQLTYPAPTGCLQYYTSPTGTIESFNFGHYLNNLDYAICIERQPDTCRIIFTATDANFGIEPTTGNLAGVGDVDCSADYLQINGGLDTDTGLTHDRFCGSKLAYSSTSQAEQPVITKANGPLVVRFHSNSQFYETINEGFRVKYEQSPTECTTENSATVLSNDPNNPNPFAPIVVAMLETGHQTKPMKLPGMYHSGGLQQHQISSLKQASLASSSAASTSTLVKQQQEEKQSIINLDDNQNEMRSTKTGEGTNIIMTELKARSNGKQLIL